MFLLNFCLQILITSSLNPLDLSAQLESLHLAADQAVGFVNARGTVLVVRLYDIPNRVREVALHVIRHGAAMALPWRWLLHKFTPATIFGFFPMELQPPDTLEIMSAWSRIFPPPPIL